MMWLSFHFNEIIKGVYMFQDFSYAKLSETNSGDINNINDSVIDNDVNNSSGISKVITGVVNDSESNIERRIHFSDAEITDTPKGKKFLRHVLIGSTVLAGIGALAAGGVYYFTGRHNTGNRLENMVPSNLPVSVDSVVWGIGGSSLTAAGSMLRSELSSTVMPETSLSPYSYYENKRKEMQKQPSQQVANSITDKASTVSEQTNVTPQKRATRTEAADITTISPSTSPYTVTKTYAPAIYENHEKARMMLYNDIILDYDEPQPLGPRFHNQVALFCYSELIKPAIEQAYEGDEKEKCDLLNSMSDIIEGFIEDEILLIDKNNQLEKLTRGEYIKELTMRRAITTLIMAAESIIKNEDFDEFYTKALRDYKQYSTDEIDERNSAIWDYISESECSDSYEDSSY